MDGVTIKESYDSEADYMITLRYFRNTSSSIISILVMHWEENNILTGVNSIQ